MKKFKRGQFEYYTDQDNGVYPRFSTTLSKRVRQKRATNVSVSGEGGIGKTYTAIDICRGLTKKFTIDQVVFNYYDFLQAVLNTPMGVPIVFDEPSYAMGKREWYKDLNQALVKTIESFRYKVHPLFIPIINDSLLDKTIRSYLLQFQIVVHNRGLASVYRKSPSPFQDKTYKYFFCSIKYPLFDRHLCNKDSCLGCKYLLDTEEPCQVFRAQYERKKGITQEERYEQDLEIAKRKEGSKLTNAQIAELVLPHISEFRKENGTFNIPMFKAFLEVERKIIVGQNRAYDIIAVVKRKLNL